jgi:hypothetical protein
MIQGLRFRGLGFRVEGGLGLRVQNRELVWYTFQFR